MRAFLVSACFAFASANSDAHYLIPECGVPQGVGPCVGDARPQVCCPYGWSLEDAASGKCVKVDDNTECFLCGTGGNACPDNGHSFVVKDPEGNPVPNTPISSASNAGSGPHPKSSGSNSFYQVTANPMQGWAFTESSVFNFFPSMLGVSGGMGTHIADSDYVPFLNCNEQFPNNPDASCTLFVWVYKCAHPCGIGSEMGENLLADANIDWHFYPCGPQFKLSPQSGLVHQMYTYAAEVQQGTNNLIPTGNKEVWFAVFGAVGKSITCANYQSTDTCENTNGLCAWKEEEQTCLPAVCPVPVVKPQGPSFDACSYQDKCANSPDEVQYLPTLV